MVGAKPLANISARHVRRAHAIISRHINSGRNFGAGHGTMVSILRADRLSEPNAGQALMICFRSATKAIRHVRFDLSNDRPEDQ
jgi:hypothetical protein